MALELTTVPGIRLVQPVCKRQGLFCRIETLLRAYGSVFTLTVLIAMFLCLQALLPLGTAIKIGADEDYELAKATLCNHGYKLYTEIWNDQPPLVTIIIAALAKHAANPILAARLMTVGFSVVLLIATFALVRALSGLRAAALATALLIGSPGFLELSSSVMQEIPALAPVVVCLGLLWPGPGTQSLWTASLAGAVFGFALQMKLIGVVYLPIVALTLWVRISHQATPDIVSSSPQARTFWVIQFVKAGLTFGISMVVAFVVLNFLTGNSLLLQLRQSWAAHFAQTQSFEYGSPQEHGFDWTLLLKNWDTTVPALAGVCILLRRCRRAWEPAIPLVWLGLSLLVFGAHKPWWAYYYIHNALPLSWCAGVGISTACGWLVWRFEGASRNRENGHAARSAPKGRPTRLVSPHHSRPWCQAAMFGILAVCAATWAGSRIFLEEQAIRSAPRLYSALVLKEIERFKPFTRFMFSDRPIYSFHADLPMPPHLAVISLKRLWTGDLTNAGLAAELESVKPGLILLGNPGKPLPYDELLNREYRLVYQDSANRLYAHESISKKPISSLLFENAPADLPK